MKRRRESAFQYCFMESIDILLPPPYLTIGYVLILKA